MASSNISKSILLKKKKAKKNGVHLLKFMFRDGSVVSLYINLYIFFVFVDNRKERKKI